MFFQQRACLTVTVKRNGRKRPPLGNVGHTHLSFTLQVFCVGICFYAYVLLEPPEVFHDNLGWIACLLALTILPIVLLPRELGFKSTKEHKFWRWLLALASVGLLVRLLWGKEMLRPVGMAITRGASYWILTLALYAYLFATLTEHDQPLFRGQAAGMTMARTAMVLTLTFIATYAFGYRLFPLIPVDKGGGNYFSSGDARLCFGGTERVLPKDLMNGQCSFPVKIIAATDSALYVALSSVRVADEAGREPTKDARPAPESWAEGDYFPAIYSIERSELAYFEYMSKTSGGEGQHH